jgi:HK97 family phage prohead protease
MDDYEAMTRRRAHEDSRRGYSIGGSGGPIMFVDRQRANAPPTIRRSGSAQILEGFAVLYNKAHSHKGGVEIFKRGCFDRTLSTKSLVKFYIDHQRDSICLGDTDTNLELVDSDVGLGFRLKLSSTALERLDGRDRMSVGYNEIDVEVCTILDENVRLIKSGSLTEISAVHNPAVKQTYAIVRDAAHTGRLQDDIKRSFPSDSASAAFQRALRKLQNAL